MNYFLTKKFDGTFTMSWIGNPTSTDEISTQVRDIKTFSITPTKSIKSITNFSDVIKGETTEHYFKKFFSYSNTRSGVSYSDMSPISDISQEYCSLNNLYLNLSYFRIDSTNNTIPTLTINTIVIEGTYDIEETDDIIEVPNDGYIFTPKNIYKVFKLTGFELYGVNTNNLIFKYRFTQDNGRTYTPWEPLTTENISTIKINPIRFAQVQYSVQKIDNSINSKVYDIILLGDFQNINNYYLKTNRYGVREDCAIMTTTGNTSSNVDNTQIGDNSVCVKEIATANNGKYKGDGPKSNNNYNRDWITQGLSCYLTGNVISSLGNSSVSNTTSTGADSSTSIGTYDPYAAAKKIGNWYNYLASSVGKYFGWSVDYHLTDPDGKGIDKYLHEYQLNNIVDIQKIKIIVPDNTFPDNQVQINEYMLDMMDTFQVIILKDDFHNAFGIEKRPSQKDIIYFCQANRMYRVKHAQVHRDIMYMGIYYNVVLEKYEKLANEQNISNTSKNLIESLTNKNTLDSLFGEEMREQENKIINKQFKPTTHEVYRSEINNNLVIVKKDIYNSLKEIKIADNYYNLSSMKPGLSAITYTLQDSTLNVSDNRAFNIWFNFNNKYDNNKQIDEQVYQSYNINNNTYYEFLNNYNSDKNKGYKLWYSNKQLILTINEYNYILDVPNLTTNIWYGLSVNIDNRQGTISLDLYKRNYNYKITMFNYDYNSIILDATDTTGMTYYTSTGYRPVKNTEQNIKLKNSELLNIATINYENVPVNSFNIDQKITIYSSDIKLTNIRIFDDVIPNESKSNILQQRIIKDSNFLILADNATRELYTQNIKNTRWE